MIRISICDDNALFASSLESTIIKESRKLGIRIEIDIFSDGETLVKSIQNGNQYELIFIDIEMERMNGIDAARIIRNIDRTVLFIYVSSYENYLADLFEVEPFRFLHKPIDFEKFKRYFHQAINRISEKDTFYQFTFNREIRKVTLKNVVYFESRGRIIHIYLSDGSSEHFYGKLNEVESNLQDSRVYFLRIHQSFLINYDYVKKINYSNIIISWNNEDIDLKISEDRQKNIRMQLCEIAGGKAVIE